MSETSHNNDARWPLATAWGLAGLVSLLAIVSWGQKFGWQLWPLSPYLLFPVLGVLAFSLMWVHYVIGAICDLCGASEATLKSYFRITGYLVLALLFLHPGLLIYQRFRDGFGLPPESYVSYVAPGLGWVALLGSVSLLIFLAFELHRFFGEKSWWQYVVDASDVAMLGILYHGLRLGNFYGWFRVLWLFYGVVFIAIVIRKYWFRFQATKRPASSGPFCM